MEKLADEIHPGSTPKEALDAFADSGVLFMRSENVLNGKVVLSEDQRYIKSDSYDRFPRLQIRSQDVLINIIGASIGRCAIYDGRLGRAVLNQNICLIRCNEGMLVPEFLCQLLLSDRYQSFFKGTGRSGAQYD